MKRGDVVRVKKTGKVGMIVWRKNNQEIGINIGHYSIIMATRGKCELADLTGLGCDDLFSKEDLEIV